MMQISQYAFVHFRIQIQGWRDGYVLRALVPVLRTQIPSTHVTAHSDL